MISENGRVIAQRMTTGAMKKIFNSVILPTLLKEDGTLDEFKIHDILAYSTMFTPFIPGNIAKNGSLMIYGEDEKGRPEVYLIHTNYDEFVIQANSAPGTIDGEVIYSKYGYRNGKKLWIQPTSELDSYNLDETVEKLITSEPYEITVFVNGGDGYKDQVFLYNEKWYKIVPNQIKFSDTYVTPGSNPSIYEELTYDYAEQINSELILRTYKTYKSNKDDNRFVPGSNITWDEVVETNV